MNGKDKHEDLLVDVLQDEDLITFKESLLLQCQRRVARKRIRRFQWWMVPAAAALLLIFFRVVMEPDIKDTETPLSRQLYAVSTVPLSVAQRVFTPSTIQKNHAVHTRADPDLVVRTTSSADLVRTDQEAARLTDDEMLALFPDIPCGFVQRKGQKKSLLFLFPEDEERYVVKIKG
jgi:hypothetical protein